MLEGRKGSNLMNDLKDAPLHLLDTFPAVADESWRAAVEADLKGADFDKKLVWQTFEGLKVQPYYRGPALEGLGYLESAPGQQPWHRGPSPDGNAWSIVQEVASPQPLAANAAAREALEGGADGVCFVCEPVEKGVRGVNLQTLDDMSALLGGLPLDRAEIHIQAKSFALPLLGSLLAALEESKADPAALRGSVDYDPLADLIRQGAISGSREEIFFQTAKVLEYCAANLPRLRVLSIQGGVWLEAGGSAVQEIAFVLAALSCYLNGLRERGAGLETLLPRLQVQFSVGSTYFMEIAKLRTARMLIARVLGAYLGDGVAVPAVPVLARGASFYKALYDPHTNLLRATTEAMAAAIGGADAIVAPPFESVYRNPDATALRLSRNIQLLLKHEAYLDKVADPAAGSYLFETLTDSLAAASWKLFQEVEAMGGFLSAAANGFLQREIAAVASKKRQAIASRRQVLLGVNQYPNLQEAALGRLHPQGMTSSAEPNRRPFHADSSDVLPALKEAFKAGVVLGDALTALGRKENLVAQPVRAFRAAEGFEAIRLRTERYAAVHGHSPTVFLLKTGDLAMRQARAGFISNFFGCAGFSVVDNLGFTSAADGVEAAVAAKADIVVLCSADAEYVGLATEACPLLKEKLPKAQIVVAGYPKDALDALRDLGVDDFVHIRSVAEETLIAYQRKLGILPMEDGRQ